jgi:hypothetical protein
MTVSHIWYDAKLTNAENLENCIGSVKPSYDPSCEGFKCLQRCAILCSIADFNQGLPTDKQLTGKEVDAIKNEHKNSPAEG